MKRELINEILTLTKLQGTALEEDNMDEFTNLVEKKQICIDKVKEITDNNFSMLDNEDKEILLEATEIDKENLKEFETQYEEVKLQLRKIRSLKKRDDIYSNPYDMSFGEGVFIDKK